MKLLRGVIAAFSMYSSIPMPQIGWGNDVLRWALICFPLVGAVIGGLFFAAGALCAALGAADALRSALLLTAVIGVPGGIHLDGFCDVSDALSSHQEPERRLEILQDPHVGAFAVIGCTMYLLLYFGLLFEMEPAGDAAAVTAVGFVLSRTLSAAAAVTLPAAKKNGTLVTFTEACDRRAVRMAALAVAVVCAAAMLLLDPFCGAAALMACLIAAFCCYRTAMGGFGGITGDIAGWWVCVCELSVCAAATAVELILGGILA